MNRWPDCCSLFILYRKMSDSTPTTAQSGSFLKKPLQTPRMQEIKTRYNEYLSAFGDIHTAVLQHTAIDNQMIIDVVARIISDLRDSQNDMKQFMLYGLQGGSSFLQNAVNTAIISALLGLEYEFSRQELQELATGALLHDLGMLRIPEEIITKKGSLSGEELRLVHTYPVHSYRIITGDLAFPDEIGVIALQHQERWNGGGYPRSLVGKAIHRNARIVAVADAFEAMLSTRPYRSSMDGYNAVRALLRDNGQRFDPDVIRIFIRTFGIYPRGCLVLLNDASIGRVVDVFGSMPLRPQVKIMIAADGSEYYEDDGPLVDLRSKKRLFIVRAINQEQLQGALADADS